MAKYGNYGWSPRQMERINERRAERGQEELRSLQYEDRPQQERKRATASITEEPEKEGEEESLKARQAKRTEEFRKKFGVKGSMGIERGVKSSIPSVINKGVKGGVGVMQDSLDRFSAST